MSRKLQAVIDSAPINDPPPRTPLAARQRIPAAAYAEDMQNAGYDETPVLHLIRGDEVKIKPIPWVWTHYLAGGKLHIAAGQAGIGKTTCALGLGAIISAGSYLPDGSRATQGDVLIWSGEDDVADTLAPRLLAMGADMTRLHFVAGMTIRGDRVAFDPAKHMEALRDQALRLPALKLIIIDPIVSAIAGDSHKNGEVRRGLAPLQELAENTGAALLGISHFTKGSQTKDPIERVTGSLAFGAATRILFAVARRKEVGDAVFMRAKSNIGPTGGGFTFQIEQVDVPGHRSISASVVRWTGAIEGDAREILQTAEAFEEGGSRQDDAKAFLVSILADGPMHAEAVYREAGAAGHSNATIRRASENWVVKEKELGKGGRWKWALPVTQA